MLLISDQWIHWIVSDKHPESQDMASVTIKQAVFHTQYSVFTLYGLVSFDNCTFIGLLFSMYIHRSQYEPKPSEEMIKTFQSYLTQHKITFDRCQFNLWFHFYVIDAVREIHIVQCKIEKLYSKINIGKETQCNLWVLARLSVENNTMLDTDMYADLLGPTTFAFIAFTKMDMNRSDT